MKKHKFVQGCSQVLSHKSVRESFFVGKYMHGAYYFMGNCTTEWTFGGSRLKEIQGKTFISQQTRQSERGGRMKVRQNESDDESHITY